MEHGALASPSNAGGTPFGELVERFLARAADSSDQANTAVRDLALGNTDNLHEVMLHVAQADLSFRLILEIRNRLAEAYQEIMKMQI
jgi:flagellar hook-basal body complex protein FliE